jgi:hypothetical protein
MKTYGDDGILHSIYGTRSAYSTPYNQGPIQIYELPRNPDETPAARLLEQDAGTLSRMVSQRVGGADDSVVQQLFGGQAGRLKFSLEHAVNLLNERRHLHKRLIGDINHRHMQIQERLFGARLHGRLDGYKNALRLEQTLLQLDEQRRREELQFWKDTVDIREGLFESAGDYHALRMRMSLFEGLDGGIPDV